MISPSRKFITRVIDHLISRLNDSDPHICQEAAINLGDLQGDGGRAVQVLLDRVQSTEVTPHDRACAAWALGRIGPHTKEVVPILVSVLKEAASQPDADELCRCAAEAIESLTDDRGILMTVARLCLIDRYYKCKLIGLMLVERLGDRGPDLLPLVDLLRSDEVVQVRAAARRIMTELSWVELHN